MSGGGIAEDFVEVTVSSNINDFVTIRRFPKDASISTLKGKLELLTGVEMNSMKLELRTKEGELKYTITDDALTLAQMQVENGMQIHVMETNKNSSLLSEDTPDVAFQLPDEEYEKREESVRKFLMTNKLGKYDEEKKKKVEEMEAKEKELGEALKGQIGSRVEVRVSHPHRRGELMFVGSVHFKPGVWVGVKYDEPEGKNDGSIDGKRYFTCKPKYGGFVRPSGVVVGDFPEIDPFEEL